MKNKVEKVNTSCPFSGKAFDAGKQDAYFGGINAYYELQHLCLECRLEYFAGFSKGQDELLEETAKSTNELQRMWETM